MKAEAQRIAIAESVGWKYVKDTGNGPFGVNPSVKTKVEPDGEMDFIPDYLNDLNAIHEVEKGLSAEQRQVFMKFLLFTHDKLLALCSEADKYWVLCHATASQRAEAYLRTIGKWEDA